MIQSIDELIISLTPDKGEKRILTMEEKKIFMKEKIIPRLRIQSAFRSGIPIREDEGLYKLENSPYDQK